ncbi:RAD50-interacting protein 1 [Lobulomyces angularis]|nr:RAD50-interacting protein 1 [Lobulomyces angularis]
MDTHYTSTKLKNSLSEFISLQDLNEIDIKNVSLMMNGKIKKKMILQESILRKSTLAKNDALKTKISLKVLKDEYFSVTQLLQDTFTSEIIDTLKILTVKDQQLENFTLANLYLEVLAAVTRIIENIAKSVDVPRTAIPFLKELISFKEQGYRTLIGKQHDFDIKTELQLTNYINLKIKSFQEVLESNLSLKFEMILTELGWPNALTVKKMEQNYKEFRSIVSDLVLLPSNAGEKRTHLLFTILSKKQLVRLKYHFSGDRPTNRIDKPDWLFSYIKNIVREQSEFIHAILQPLLDELGISINGKVEFLKILLNFAIKKLKVDSKKLINTRNLHQFCQNLFETLKFDVSLAEEFEIDDGATFKNYVFERVFLNMNGCKETRSGESALDINYFHTWLDYEKNFNLSILQEISKKEDFSLVFGGMVDIASFDEFRLTRMGSDFITLLESITGRNKLIAHVSNRLQFFQKVQTSLIKEFLLECKNKTNLVLNRFTGNVSKRLDDSLEKTKIFCSVLATLNYVISIMKEWRQETFFMEMSELNSAGDIFDEFITDYESVCEQLIEFIASECFEKFVESIWISVSNEEVEEITKELVEPLEYIKKFSDEYFLKLPRKINLNVNLQILKKLDEFLFENLLLLNKFSISGFFIGGVSQNLFKIENYFRKCREGLTVLEANKNSILNILSELKRVEQEDEAKESKFVVPKKSMMGLENIGFYKLSKSELLNLVDNRTDI